MIQITVQCNTNAQHCPALPFIMHTFVACLSSCVLYLYHFKGTIQYKDFFYSYLVLFLYIFIIHPFTPSLSFPFQAVKLNTKLSLIFCADFFYHAHISFFLSPSISLFLSLLTLPLHSRAVVRLEENCQYSNILHESFLFSYLLPHT